MHYLLWWVVYIIKFINHKNSLEIQFKIINLIVNSIRKVGLTDTQPHDTDTLGIPNFL